MKITRISAQNYLGIRSADIALTRPVQLFAGANAAGKSSLQEAVRHALTGETVRVSLKKDYSHLMTEGTLAGYVEVIADDAGYSVALPSGKGAAVVSGAINYVLDAQRFAHLTADERRAFLFGLMGLSSSGDAVQKRLADKGFDERRIGMVMPLLRAGFDAACKETQCKARDAKASWKTATGGETWGKEKAAKWSPAALPEDADRAGARLENAQAKLEAADQALADAQQHLGAARSADQRRQQQSKQRAELEERAGKIDRIRAKLAKDEAELAEWEAKVAATREMAGAAPVNPKAPGEFLLRGLASVTDEFLCVARSFPDPFDESLINRASAHLSEYKKLHGWPHSSKEPTATETAAKTEAVAKLPEHENALVLMQSAVANSKRDLAAAESAQAALTEMDLQAEESVDIETAQVAVNRATTDRDAWRADVQKYRAIAEQAERRERVIAQAADLHAEVLAWLEIADALSPDGIPGEMLAEALGPINERLHASSAVAEWAWVTIHPDMQITADSRPYALLSESEKWRADAMIAEAVSYLSGLRLLVLDRFDVLDLSGRGDAIAWLDQLALDGNIDTALVFGTLKALPSGLPDTVQAHWIESGVVGQLREAA